MSHSMMPIGGVIRMIRKPTRFVGLIVGHGP